jgi:hypothetical protein
VPQSFKEIEHKFIVSKEFDRNAFRLGLIENCAASVDSFLVEDTYFVIKGMHSYVFRHRYDRQIEQLTVKSVEKTPEIRTEINLDLLHSSISQIGAVKAFVECFGVEWSKSINKDVLVAKFADCEIVHYIATCDQQTAHCVEFEAVGFSDVNTALEAIKRREVQFGFASNVPESKSLFELIVLESAPESVRKLFLK